MEIQNSEFILNQDGSIYHLCLKPEHISKNIIFVGDQNRVNMITKHFDTIEFTVQNREFKTVVGNYKGKRITVISTGIGSDNIDIVINELDALVNIDLETRKIKDKLTSLNIIRIGTSGALQKEIPLDSFLISEYAMDTNGMLQSYNIKSIANAEVEDAFIKHTNWSKNKARPIVISSSTTLSDHFKSDNLIKGFTSTAGGFYGAQGRVLRLELQDDMLNSKTESFNFNGLKVTNLEMETSAIYGLSKLLGHKAISLNAIIANRPNGEFSHKPEETIKQLIKFTLNKMTTLNS